ncbi:Soluble guanylate cyclase 89Da [Armadillidium vulgare]|nr:Soluble guanylate cyclase 89Da [Armadillidium vulgare]
MLSHKVEYGEGCWLKVMEAAGCKNVVFNTHKNYPDSLIPRLAEACSEIFEEGDTADYMVFFGRCFVRYCSSYEEYEKMLRASARHFCQFLQEVDNVHSRMRFSYHKMKSPSMLVTAYDNEGAILQYRSRRKGFTPYLIGQLLQIANDFYEMVLEVTVIGEGAEDNVNIVNLRQA